MSKIRNQTRQLELPVLVDVISPQAPAAVIDLPQPCKSAVPKSFQASPQDQSIYDAISANYFRSVQRG